MKLKPLGTSIVIKPFEKETSIKQEEGIFFIAKMMEGDVKKMIITETGPDVKEEELQVGKTILIPKGDMPEIDIKGEKRYLIDELDILAIVEE